MFVISFYLHALCLGAGQGCGKRQTIIAQHSFHTAIQDSLHKRFRKKNGGFVVGWLVVCVVLCVCLGLIFRRQCKLN